MWRRLNGANLFQIGSSVDSLALLPRNLIVYQSLFPLFSTQVLLDRIL